MNLSNAQRDRACGTLLAAAAGDALGAGYEDGNPLAPGQPVEMIGGGLGPFKRGEWTENTSMAIAIAEIASTGADLRDEATLDYIVDRWYWWARSAKDVGVQTRSVLSAVKHGGASAQTAREASAALHEQSGRPTGNGSLMRTGPAALAHLDDEQALVTVARSVSELTHYDDEAGEACVLWCTAIRHAILTGNLDARVGLNHIDIQRRSLWARRLDDAEKSHPAAFAAMNGWVVAALQAAWSAIVTTPIPVEDPAAEAFRVDHLRLALESAVRGGGNTGTVAAIAGALLGSAYGASAVPSQWRLLLHGWPGLTTRGLVQLATKSVDNGQPEDFDFSYGPWRGDIPPVRHPHDDKVWIGGAATLHKLPAGVDAIVSLCRIVDGHQHAGVKHLDVRLVDEEGENTNLDFVLSDTVRAVEQLRAAGHTVFIHCVRANSRTPTIAALYGARRRRIDVDDALRDVLGVLPDARPNADFRLAMRRLQTTLGGAS